MTHILVEQFRNKGPGNGGYVSGLDFKSFDGSDIVEWLEENGYEAKGIESSRHAYGETACGMRVYGNGYICDAIPEGLQSSPATPATRFQNEATQHETNAYDSFERCDTDGFLSHWASGINADLARAKAQIAKDGGMSVFERLYDIAEDREINAKLIDGRYGAVWLVDEDDPHQFNGRKFIPFAGQCVGRGDQGCASGKNLDGKTCKKCKGSGMGSSQVQKQWGLEERWVEKPAHAIITGKGLGLSGSVWVIVIEVNEILEIYKENK